jgi:hypothetical protein
VLVYGEYVIPLAPEANPILPVEDDDDEEDEDDPEADPEDVEVDVEVALV